MLMGKVSAGLADSRGSEGNPLHSSSLVPGGDPGHVTLWLALVTVLFLFYMFVLMGMCAGVHSRG